MVAFGQLSPAAVEKNIIFVGALEGEVMTLNSYASSVSGISPARRAIYKFRLHRGGGGTFLTAEQDIETARDRLLARYGTDLAAMERA